MSRDFGLAVEAVITGDVAALREMLRMNPELVRARSTRAHHATLLHYIAANGVEDERQKTPANAVEVAKLLLDAGAEVDALADMYGAECTTLSMLVSSSPPAVAGLQLALAETLLDRGAALDEAVVTALTFGFRETAEALARPGWRRGRRGSAELNIAAAAGLGRVDDVARLMPSASAREKHIALALAAQHGQTSVVRLLLDAGEDPNRYHPAGYHSHSTPLHQAVWGNHGEVVRLLVSRGARLDLQDTIYSGTPLDWAIHGERTEIADYLRAQGAPGSD